jgi:lysophospholipase L1-like esterase
MTTSGPTIVACLGSSSTAGKGQAFDWIAELRARTANARIEFRNFGVGGDLAFNALQRLPGLLASRPDKVIVWIGGNDVLALVSSKARRFFALTRRLPCEPSPEWYRENLTRIVRGLKAEAAADIGLCSLCTIGEDPDSDNPFQRELNRRIEQYSGIVAAIASSERCSYIPLYEAIADEIRASPGQAFTAFRFLPFYRDAFRVLVLGKSADEVARLNGWRFHSDGVHLNSRAGHIVADRIQQFLDG